MHAEFVWTHTHAYMKYIQRKRRRQGKTLHFFLPNQATLFGKNVRAQKMIFSLHEAAYF